ncbi:MAG: hypothetical protein L6405_06945, partial [Actinomycetia bacterium]|nr:hypothetical protein [Actinomycetes bacterium]
ARALIVADKFKDKKLIKIYLNFIQNAQREDGLLHHFYYDNNSRGFNNGKGLFKNEEYNLKINIKEAYGITLWSLLTTKNNQDSNIKKIIKNLIKDAHTWTSPRAISAALLGLLNLEYQCSLEKELKVKLHNYYFETHSANWEWFENYLVYANALIPWTLWEIYLKRKCKISFEIAKKTTEFLINNCRENNIPSPIGNKGWYTRGSDKALFDQQPIDPGYMVCCLEKAYYATKDNIYLSWAEKWHKWFWGNNINSTPLIDENFACYDALTPEGVNLNQGAESNICFLMAHLAAKRLGLDPGIVKVI